MVAPKGNEFWKIRSKHGADKIFSDPNKLWESCCEYFQWVTDNPLFESKVVSRNGEPEEFVLPKMRAMTIAGLCFYLKISDDTWRRYRDDQDLCGVIANAEQVIYQQKFEGASAGLLNSNIIARDLGLTEKQETKHDVTDGLADLMREIENMPAGLPSVSG